MNKKPIGICHICGQTKELTFEHLPPRSTGNKGNIKCYDHDDLLQAYLSGKQPLTSCKYSQSQGGYQLATICENCNNTTGSYYVRSYTDFSKSMVSALKAIDSKKINTIIEFDCTIRPLNFYKQVASIFCSVLEPETVSMLGLGDFVLDKTTSTPKGKDFNIYMYLVPIDSCSRHTTAITYTKIDTITHLTVAEFISPPFGFILNLSPSSVLSTKLYDISSFRNYTYGQIETIRISSLFLKPMELFFSFEGVNINDLIVY